MQTPELLVLTVKKAQSGDMGAFSTLVEHFEGRLMVFCRRMGLFSPEDIEDCLQEAFLKAWRNINSYNEGFSFATWLYRIVRNEVYSHFRKNSSQKDQKELTPELWHENLIQEEDFIHAFDEEKRAKMLQRALESLKKEEKEILVLYFAEEMSYKDIADVLKMPTNTVATKIRRAKAHLKALLEDLPL